jgi:hypothetical protein
MQRVYARSGGADDTRRRLFEIRIDGVVRTHRLQRNTAIEAAHYLQQRNPAAEIVITDLRDGSTVPFDRRS